MSAPARPEGRPATAERRWKQAASAYLWVALGGVIGALARHAVTAGLETLAGHEAWGTFFANVSGAFLLGYFSTITAGRVRLPLNVRRFVAVGILGSYTTFSALSYQTLEMLESGNLAGAAANSAGSLIIGLLAVTAGVRLART